MEVLNRFELIAPCGMNCGICLGHLREKNHCPGCRGNKENLPKYCGSCIISNCTILKENNWKFCSDKCEKYPCLRLKNLDKRYRTKYNMSMIENLKILKKMEYENLSKVKRRDGHVLNVVVLFVFIEDIVWFAIKTCLPSSMFA